MDGASGDYDWTGTIPFDELPNVYNPPDHYIVTANNRVVGDSYPHLITTVWSPGYRAARITELITATAKLSVEDFKRIQNDTQSAYARTVISYYAALKSDDPQIQPLITSLAGWDANVTAASGPAAIYEVAYNHLMSNTLSTALGPTLAEEYLGSSAGEASLFFLNVLKDGNSPWWDDPTTTGHETRDTRLLSSLQQAATDLTSGIGDDPTTWQWGTLHQIYFAHPVAARSSTSVPSPTAATARRWTPATSTPAWGSSRPTIPLPGRSPRWATGTRCRSLSRRGSRASRSATTGTTWPRTGWPGATGPSMWRPPASPPTPRAR